MFRRNRHKEDTLIRVACALTAVLIVAQAPAVAQFGYLNEEALSALADNQVAPMEVRIEIARYLRPLDLCQSSAGTRTRPTLSC